MHVDLLDPATFAKGHPVAVYRWLQDNDPLHWHEEPDGPGFWVVTRHEDVSAVGRQSNLYSSEPTVMIPDPDEESIQAMSPEHKMMLMMDPPQHTQFRRIISKEFTKGPAQGLRPRVSELSAQIVDQVIHKGECDFVSEIAGELPSYVIAELMGIPLDDGRELYSLTETIHSAPESLPEGAQGAAIMRMFGYAQQVYRDKYDKPADDLASQIVHASVDGVKLDEIDFQLFFMLLIDAGGDTTRNLVAGGLHELIQQPHALQELQDHPSGDLMNSAREEMLRVVSPVIQFRRTARQDIEMHGKTIRAGDKVVRYFAAANRDPEIFEDPLAFDIQRFPNEQIAFGTGTHVCLGQHIARVEIDCIFHEVLSRMKNFSLPQAPEWLPSNFISGIRYMPLEYQAR
ncbi:MAG: cytochrome P450 [Pseudomonadota bacterium]